MNRHLLEAVLARHAMWLAQGDRQEIEELLRIFPDEKEELASLMQIAQQVADLLIPLGAPSPFRENLHNSLLAAAFQQEVAGPRSLGERLRAWALPLAAGASVASVAVGVVTYVELQRLRGDPVQSLSGPTG